jgi:hypothetical protein
VDIPAVEAVNGFGEVATLFGETASRVIVSVGFDQVAEFQALARAASVPAAVVGRIGGDRIRVAAFGQVVLDELLIEMESLWSNAIDRYFATARAVA